MNNDLSRFLKAQEKDYEMALSEIRAGRKRNHWMWYIFPQFKGLGFSSTSKFYAIKNRNEAEEFLSHPILGSRLIEISNGLLHLEQTNPRIIFGSPDDLKLRSSMTLFSVVDTNDGVFRKVLDKFFDGQVDQKTLELLEE